MAIVCVHGPLRNLAGGRAEQEVAGATVVELLRGLEDEHPGVRAGSSTSAGPFGGTSTCS